MTSRPKDKDPILDIKFFDLLFPIAYPVQSQNKDIYEFTKMELSCGDNLISIGSLLEKAISKAKNLTRHPTIGRDFVDGSDAKSSSVRWCSNYTSYGAPIHDIFNKKGLLRCVIYERLHDKFYYFLIPHRAYANIPKTSNIEIPFNLDGTPRRNPPRVRNVDWWQFEVADFAGILGDVAADFEFVQEKKARLKRSKAEAKLLQQLTKVPKPRRQKKQNNVSPFEYLFASTKNHASSQSASTYILNNDLLKNLESQDTQPICPSC